jgi:serine/threonine protein kinase
VILPSRLNDEAARKRFRNEARILSRLNYPSIQTIHDFETFEGHDFLISELVPPLCVASQTNRIGCAALTLTLPERRI